MFLQGIFAGGGSLKLKSHLFTHASNADPVVYPEIVSFNALIDLNAMN